MPPIVRRFHGTASELHALEFPTTPAAEVWLLEPTASALVRGSAQPESLFDLAALHAAGVELAARRTGGGAVWIRPGAVVWIDVLVPRGHRIWTDDIGASFGPVGEAWQRAFASLEVPLALVTDSPSRDELARWVCWAGQGWGELTMTTSDDGVIDKVVGLSQRRTRWGARIQGMAVLDDSASLACGWFSDPAAPTERALRRRVGRDGPAITVERDALADEVIAALVRLTD